MKTDRRDEITQNVNRNGYDHNDSDTVHAPNDRRPRNDDESAKKWPPGYWEKYEALREEARNLCGYSNMNVVALLNGHFEVRFLDRNNHEFAGPQRSERHDALLAFLAEGGKPRSAAN